MNNSFFRSLPTSRKVCTLVGIFTAFIILLLDNQTSALALPQAAAEIGGLEIYSLSSILAGCGACITMPVLGVLASRNPGRKNIIYLGGMLVCAAVALVGGLANSMFVVVIPRVALGIGSSVIYGLGYLMIYDMFEGKKLATVLGIAATMSSVGMLVSPIIMGFITDMLGWRMCFYVQIPLYVLSGLLVYIGLRIPQDEADKMKNDLGSVDGLGIFALFLLIGGLLPAFSLSTSYAPFGSLYNNVLLGAAVIGLIILIVDMRKKKELAIVPTNILKDRNAMCFSILTFLNGFTIMAIMFFLPLYMQSIMAASATESGLATTVSGILGLFLGPIIGNLIMKHHSAKGSYMVAIIANIVLHLFMIIFLKPTLPVVVIYGFMLIRSLAIVFQTMAQSAGLTIHVEEAKIPYTNSLIQLMQNLGPNFAIALFTMILMAGPLDQQIHIAFVISIIFGVLSIPVALFIRKPVKAEKSLQE